MFIVRSKADIQKPTFLAKETALFPDNCLQDLWSNSLPPVSLHSLHPHSDISPSWGLIFLWFPCYSSVLFLLIPLSQCLWRSSSPPLSPDEKTLLSTLTFPITSKTTPIPDTSSAIPSMQVAPGSTLTPDCSNKAMNCPSAASLEHITETDSSLPLLSTSEPARPSFQGEFHYSFPSGSALPSWTFQVQS